MIDGCETCGIARALFLVPKKEGITLPSAICGPCMSRFVEALIRPLDPLAVAAAYGESCIRARREQGR